MNNIIKKLFGIDKIEKEIADSTEKKILAEKAANEALLAAEEAKEKERIAKLTPKELATELKEPWVAVLDTHVNKDNIRNGFFELDWNEYFIVQLREAGYTGETEEAVIDQWFQELCRNVGAESGVNMDRRGAGFINVQNLGNGKSEIS
jgi:hypothetical protein